MRRRGGRAGFLRADPHPPTTISPERGFSGRKGSTCLARRPRRGLASCGVADHRRDMAYAPPASSTSRPRPARSLPAVQSHCVATNIRGSAIEFGGTIPDRFLSDGRIFSTTRPQKNAIHDLSKQWRGFACVAGTSIQYAAGRDPRSLAPAISSRSPTCQTHPWSRTVSGRIDFPSADFSMRASAGSTNRRS